ncbi:CHRNB1 [Mytilus edulis]|uniref:CHRNB1 n=1 Tax=Mytilus edulis TaxID=6550 RepID=A0A8S3UUL6_MYTED|nr:CHRNB1 [Mytilus edulis]
MNAAASCSLNFILLDLFEPLTSYNVSDAKNLHDKLFNESSYNKLFRPDNQVTVYARYNLQYLNSVALKNFGAERTIRISSAGGLRWEPLAVLSTSCAMIVAYFPFDKQGCSIELASFELPSNAVNLIFASTPVHLGLHDENGDWEYDIPPILPWHILEKTVNMPASRSQWKEKTELNRQGVIVSSSLHFLRQYGCFVPMGSGLFNSSTSYSVNDAKNLHEKLFNQSEYKKLFRPNNLVTVIAGYSLQYLNSLNIKTQVMSTTGLFTVIWKDSRLIWEQSSYGGIDNIYVPENIVWHPALVVLNSGTSFGGLIDVICRHNAFNYSLSFNWLYSR